MKTLSKIQLSLIVITLLVSSMSYASTENTSVAGAVPYEVGQGWVSHHFDKSTQERWLVFKEHAGNSYCIEAVVGSASYYSLTPSLELYADTSATSLLFNSNSPYQTGASSLHNGARICYASSLSNLNETALRPVKIKVPINAESEQNGFIRLRIQRTTYFAKEPAVTVLPDDGTPLPFVAAIKLFNKNSFSVNASVFSPVFGNVRATGSIGAMSEGVIHLPADVELKGPLYIVHNGLPDTMDISNLTVSALPLGILEYEFVPLR